MVTFTEFRGPTSEDFANVRALNKAFLKATSDLPRQKLQRLAASPFLLFSFREDDDEWWDDVLNDDPQQDLMSTATVASNEIRKLQSAGLGFLWQLARRNPYAARIVSAATINWCEKLSAQTLVILLDRVATRGDLITSRLQDDEGTWSRLLDSGTSAERRVRYSSQLSALQTMLTRTRSAQQVQLPAAACRMSVPNRRVADRANVRLRDEKV